MRGVGSRVARVRQRGKDLGRGAGRARLAALLRLEPQARKRAQRLPRSYFEQQPPRLFEQMFEPLRELNRVAQMPGPILRTGGLFRTDPISGEVGQVSDAGL